jgi:BirA family biotin operon repressor/biotin-[acetyl-CoA-carboxylase] ligase
MREVNRLLELLWDRGEDYFSLSELADTVGVDRVRLEALLDLLRHRGHSLELTPDRGIRLARPVRLDAHLIERSGETERVGRSVICFDEVDSTNDVALAAAEQAGSDGLVVLAEHQRVGRGRQGRKWISPSRKNILMSVLLIDSAGRLAHEALTIAAGLSVAEAIESACGLDARLKWPNDVLLEGEKVCGILVEMRTDTQQRALVVGMGINVNAAPPPGDVDAAATCIADHVHRDVRRIEVVREVLRRLDKRVELVEAGRLDELHNSWVSRSDMLNERITVVCRNNRYVGRVLDVSPLDGLVLSCDTGEQVKLPAANSTVVPT